MKTILFRPMTLDTFFIIVMLVQDARRSIQPHVFAPFFIIYASFVFFVACAINKNLFVRRMVRNSRKNLSLIFMSSLGAILI